MAIDVCVYAPGLSRMPAKPPAGASPIQSTIVPSWLVWRASTSAPSCWPRRARRAWISASVARP
jgi:hypothetical protein